MEGSRGPFFPSGCYHHHQPPTSDAQAPHHLLAPPPIPAVHSGAPANPNHNQQQQPPPPPAQQQQRVITREQDQYMPIANVIRIMRRMLPSHAKISDEAKETVQECVSEFISFITSEANQKCQQEQRKTVTADDLLWAMEKLGFDDYVGPISLYLNRYRDCNRCGPTPLLGPPPALEISVMPVPPQQPPPYYYEYYPVGVNNQMGSSGGSSGGASGGGGGPAYYDPYGYMRNDRC